MSECVCISVRSDSSDASAPAAAGDVVFRYRRPSTHPIHQCTDRVAIVSGDDSCVCELITCACVLCFYLCVRVYVCVRARVCAVAAIARAT